MTPDYGAILQYPPAGAIPKSFVFSIHKAGSSLLFGMLESLAQTAGLPAISLPDVLFLQGVLETSWGVDSSLLPYFRNGYIYYGFREFPPILEQESELAMAPCVLLIRDPRDALVSEFFSFSGRYMSHVLPANNSEELIARAMMTDHLSIDEYVIQAAPGHRQKLETYIARLPRQDTLLLFYDDVFNDKYTALSKTLRHLHVDVDEDTIRAVSKQFDIRPAAEDPTQHIRRATPGDHRNKLSPETIAWLDEYFAGVMTQIAAVFLGRPASTPVESIDPATPHEPMSS